jgi:hypothetical protein
MSRQVTRVKGDSDVGQGYRPLFPGPGDQIRHLIPGLSSAGE